MSRTTSNEHQVDGIFRRLGVLHQGSTRHQATGVNVKPLRTLNLWTVVLGFALLFPALAGCYPTYSARSITTRVVDSETKQPIAGVIVVAYWGLDAGEGGAGNLMLLETVTDSSGTFRFPAWGPKGAPIGRLENNDPAVLLFKDGYQSEVVHNPFRGVDLPEGVRGFYYDGKEVEMHKFAGAIKDWARHLEWFTTFIQSATAGHCEWKKIPRLLMALGKEREKLNAAGIGVGNYYDQLVGNDSYQAREGCGSVRDFLQEQGR